MKNKWIRVEDQLPEEDVRVLVYVAVDRCILGTNIDTDRILKGEWVRWGTRVTHWMPLPEPPAENHEKVQTMPEKTPENVQEIDDMSPMDAWRIISANMQQLYKRRKAENPNPDWKGYTDAEIRAEVICFEALKQMQAKENESNAKTPTQKEKPAKTK